MASGRKSSASFSPCETRDRGTYLHLAAVPWSRIVFTLSTTKEAAVAHSAKAITIFVALAATVYAIAAIRGLFHPLNRGKELFWAGATLALAALAAFRRRDRMTIRLALAGEGLALVGIAVLTGRVVELFVAAALLVVSHALGATILDAADPGADDRLGRMALSLAVGITLLALVFLGLAAARVLYRPVLWLAMAAAALISRRELARELDVLRAWRPLRESAAAPPSLATRTAVIVGGYLFVLAFLWAVAPEVRFDAVSYHLVVPRDYLIAHRIARPLALAMYLAHLTEAFYGFGMGLGGDGVAKLLALAFGMAAVIAVGAIARRLAGPEAGMWAAILFGSTPIVHSLSTAAYADVSEGFFLAASVLALLRIRDRASGASFLLCAGLAGAAGGVKLTALFAAPVIALLAILELSRRRRGASMVAIVAAGGAATAFALLPWYAVNFAFTGSPTYPIPNPLFPGRGISDAMGVYKFFGLGRSWKSALAMVPALTFSPRRFGEALVAGEIGLVVLLAVLLVVALAAGRRPTRIVAAIALALFAGWWGSVQYGRYLVPAISIAIPAIFAIFPWRSFRLRPVLRAAVFSGIVAQSLVIPVQYWMLAERFPLALAFGQSRRTFLSTVIGPYAAVEWLNGAVGPGEKVAAFRVGGVRFYCRAPMSGWNDTVDLRYVPVSDPAAIERGLEAGGYRWVLSRVPRPGDVSPSWEDFLARHARLAVVRNGFRVHRLTWGAAPAGP